MTGADPRILGNGAHGLTGWALLRAVAVLGLVCLLLGSRVVAAAADPLPEWAAPLRSAAQGWDATMAQAGLTAPYDAIHQAIATVVQAGWRKPI